MTKSDEQFIANGGTFNEDHGEKILSFLERYICDSKGNKFKRLDWITEVIHSWFSWRNPDGTNRCKIGFLTVGRQVGKSFAVAGIALHHLLHIPGARVLVVACTQDQAKQIYQYIESSKLQNVDHGNGKLKCLRLKESSKEIWYDKTNSVLKIGSADAKGKYGQPQSLIVIDEGAHHPKDDLWTALKDSTNATGGMKLVISSAGWNKNGFFFRMLEDARKILSGDVVDTQVVPWIFELPHGSDYDRADNWTKCCPSLGTTCTEEQFRADWERAKRDPSEKLSFVRLRFNNWSETEGATWIDPTKWELCSCTLPDLTASETHLGLDFGHVSDLTAITAVHKREGKYFIQTWGFVPKDAIKLARDKKNAVMYQVFKREGTLTEIDGNAIDIEQDIEPFLDDLLRKYPVRSITVDKWQTYHLAGKLQRRGYQVFEMGPYATQQNGPMNDIITAVENKTLQHNGCQLLRWQIGHALADRNNKGYIRIEKPTESQKIDNLVALIQAWSRAMLGEVEIAHPFSDPKQEVQTIALW